MERRRPDELASASAAKAADPAADGIIVAGTPAAVAKAAVEPRELSDRKTADAERAEAGDAAAKTARGAAGPAEAVKSAKRDVDTQHDHRTRAMRTLADQPAPDPPPA